MALTSFSAQGALGPLHTLAQVNAELARQREQRRREREAKRQQALRTVGQVAGMAIGAGVGSMAGGVGAVPGAMAGGAIGSTAGGLAGGQGISAGEMLNTGLTVANMQQQQEARQQAQQQRLAEQEMIRGALQPTQDYQRQLSAAQAAPALNAERQRALNTKADYEMALATTPALAQDTADFPAPPAPSALAGLAIPEQPTALPFPPPGGALDPRTMGALQAAIRSSDPMKSLALLNVLRRTTAPPPPPELVTGRPGDVFLERGSTGLEEVTRIPDTKPLKAPTRQMLPVLIGGKRYDQAQEFRNGAWVNVGDPVPHWEQKPPDPDKPVTMKVTVGGKQYAKTFVPKVGGEGELLGDAPQPQGSERERMLGFVNEMTYRRYNEPDKITPQDKVKEQSYRQVLARPFTIVLPDGSRRDEVGFDFEVYDEQAKKAHAAQQPPPTEAAPLPLPESRRTATTTPKPFSPTEATQQSMIRQANVNVKQVIATVAPKDGKIDRTLVLEMQDIAGVEGVPFSRGREVRQGLLDSLETKIRLESGAAVPQEEIVRLLTRYLPSPLDSDAAIRGKMARLDAFFDGAVDLMDFGRGAFSDETMGKLARLKATQQKQRPTVSEQYGLER